MEYVSNRDIVVRSTHGHAIEFLKGMPTEAPKVMHRELIEKGILPMEVEVGKTELVAPEPPKVMLAPEDAGEREDKILDVIRAIVKRNNSKDFSGGGHPSAKAISSALGWQTDQKEVQIIWLKNREVLSKEARETK